VFVSIELECGDVGATAEFLAESGAGKFFLQQFQCQCQRFQTREEGSARSLPAALG
jgi:hypothetical protein